jgi:methionyl-tRNA synthetase
MYMHHYWGGEAGWFINMPLWAAPIIGFIMLLALWSLVWKGLALWHAGRRGEPWWFVALLLINTLGILEIIYLFWFAKLKFHELFTKHEHRS